MRHSRGFTIIELVTVIVLIGIVGVAIVARFLTPNAFNEGAAADGIITTIRAAQQAALGRATVTFEINSGSGEWVFEAKDGGSTIRSFEVTADNVILETGSAVASGNTCPNAFDTAVAGDFQLAFDNKGNLASFTNGGVTELAGATFNGVRICLNDKVDVSACVSPAGYAYVGNCDD